MRKSRLYWLHQDNLLFCPCRQVSSRDGLLLSFWAAFDDPYGSQPTTNALPTLYYLPFWLRNTENNVCGLRNKIFVSLMKSEIFHDDVVKLALMSNESRYLISKYTYASVTINKQYSKVPNQRTCTISNLSKRSFQAVGGQFRFHYRSFLKLFEVNLDDI